VGVGSDAFVDSPTLPLSHSLTLEVEEEDEDEDEASYLRARRNAITSRKSCTVIPCSNPSGISESFD